MKRLLIVLWIALSVSLFGCGEGPPFHSMDVSGADFGKDFRLSDTNGQIRSLADFRGKIVMIFFGYVQCPVVCPDALIRAAEVRRALGSNAKNVQVLFVTLDPERDTPTVIKDYTNAFDPSFIGLYSDLSGTQAVAREFRAMYQKVPQGDSYSVDHTAYTYVYDALGRLRLRVKHDQPSDQTTEDVRKLLLETLSG